MREFHRNTTFRFEIYKVTNYYYSIIKKKNMIANYTE